jgi:hypothetical protein
MTIAYTWQFESLDVYPTYQTVTDAVESIHWMRTATDGLGHFAYAYGEAKAGPVDVNNFTPFEDLTLAIVSGWTETILGTELATIDANLDAQIADLASPTLVSHPPPWSYVAA